MRVLFVESHNLDRPDPLGSHHYIRLFAERGHDCLWLGPAVSPFHLFKPDRLNRERFRTWRGGIRRVDGVQWLVPLTLFFYYDLPLLRSKYVGRNQYFFSLPPINSMLKKTGFSPVDLLWFASPVGLGLLDALPHRLSVYRLADRLDQFNRIPASINVLSEELIRSSSLVLATSRSLQQWAQQKGDRNVHYLPNGVDDIFFAPDLPVPADFPSDGRPVVVYLGTLDSRFDADLVAGAVKNYRNCHFLLIGPVTAGDVKERLKRLEGEDNFSLAGPREHHLAPAYLRHSSAGIIPFKQNRLTEAVNPIKYYEYLASGLPVVAPPLRELVEMKGPACFYENPESFGGALEKAVKQGAAERRTLVEYARGRSWRARFEQVMEILQAEALENVNGLQGW